MILVVGARSGTTLTTEVLKVCGGSTGGNFHFNEHIPLRENLIKPYILSRGKDPRGIDPLITPSDVIPFPTWRKKVLRILPPTNPLLKCAKSCHFWNLWHEHFPEMKWVICRRPRSEIVDSCMRASFLPNKPREWWEGWVIEHEVRYQEIVENCNAKEIWPGSCINNPQAFEEVVRLCELQWDLSKIESVIDPHKWTTPSAQSN